MWVVMRLNDIELNSGGVTVFSTNCNHSIKTLTVCEALAQMKRHEFEWVDGKVIHAKCVESDGGDNE